MHLHRHWQRATREAEPPVLLLNSGVHTCGGRPVAHVEAHAQHHPEALLPVGRLAQQAPHLHAPTWQGRRGFRLYGLLACAGNRSSR